jgi:hypothetical protein
MKLFENIAEYQAFKRKYELMGKLEEERMREAAHDPKSLEDFLRFMDEVLSMPVESAIRQQTHDAELQADIERQRVLNRIPLIVK